MLFLHWVRGTMPPAKVPGWTQSVVHSVLPQAISPVARAAPGCPHLSLQSWCRLQSLAVGLMHGDPTGCCMPAPCTLLRRPSSFCTFSTVNFSPTHPRRILPPLLFRFLALLRISISFLFSHLESPARWYFLCICSSFASLLPHRQPTYLQYPGTDCAPLNHAPE